MKRMDVLLRLLFAKNRNEYTEVLYDYIHFDNVYRFVRFGDDNQGKHYLYISVGDMKKDMINAEHIGFFALLNKYVMANLLVASQLNLIPFVNWGETIPYYDGHDNNVFLSYFQQVSDVDESEIFNSRNVCLSYKMAKDIENYGNTYVNKEKMQEKYAVLFKKYIRLKPEVENYINDNCFKKNKISPDVIGVHVRGVEWGRLKSHPVPAVLDQYFVAIDQLLVRYSKIFLATDSEATVKAFRNKYGCEKIIINDVNRTPEGSEQLIIFNTQLNNKYQLGLQVLLDMYSLSYCGALVAGISNVSFTSRYVKRSRGEKYIDEILIDNGIVSKGISLKKCIKKQKNM